MSAPDRPELGLILSRIRELREEWGPKIPDLERGKLLAFCLGIKRELDLISWLEDHPEGEDLSAYTRWHTRG